MISCNILSEEYISTPLQQQLYIAYVNILFTIVKNLNNLQLKAKINILFDGIETEEEVLTAFQLFNYRTEIEGDKLIITNSDSDDYCNPLYPEPQEEHILPYYMLQNFLLFRAAVTDCIMGKFPNDLDFWIYTCRYLLMDDKEFKHCGYGPNGQNFPHKNE